MNSESKIRLGVVGMGFIGGAAIQAFQTVPSKVVVNTFDIDTSKNPTHRTLAELVDDSDVIFICVPSPMKQNGECDTSIVEKVISQIAGCVTNEKVVVIRSTVPPGTTDAFQKKYGIKLVFNPEFLTEKNALYDFLNASRVVIGSEERTHLLLVKTLYETIMLEDTPYYFMTTKEAEYVKYVSNCFLATKVSFFNEVFQMMVMDGVRYRQVIQGVIVDPRIGPSHTTVPGPDGSFGFGGTCFPKDINAFIHHAKKLGIEPTVLEAAWKKNLEIRPNDERDWEAMIGRAVSAR